MPTKQKSSKANLFSRIDERVPEAVPLSNGPNVFSADEYGAHVGISGITACWRLRTKLLPQGIVRRVRTKRNGKTVMAWEMVG